MRSGFRVGKAFGIEIRADWSWLLILVLVIWNLSTTFSGVHRDWGPVLVWGIAIVAALLFFGSVLAHELAHSLVARARGIPVRDITLFLFGGVSNIQREPAAPGAEFFMAIVGPLTSLVLGGLLVLLAGASVGPVQDAIADPTQAAARLNPLLTLVIWLGSVNVTVGLFNLIPGFPLDGGRVLRSILWAATGNLRRATRWAAGVGQAIAWIMIVGGIAMTFGARIPFFGTGLGGGLWLAFIGWFLNTASAQSYQQVVINDILEGVPVSRMMRKDPPTCRPTCTIARLVHEHILGTDDQAFPVLDGSQVVGLVTLEDVRRVARDAWDTMSVGDVMTPADRLVVVAPEEDASQALKKLTSADFRQLPVVHDGELVGLLRRRDVITWLQVHAELTRGRASGH
jgi:Zn-dependent protease/predicted transcriptional regulator